MHHRLFVLNGSNLNTLGTREPELYRLFQSRPAASKFNAMTLESLGMYETATANGAITLSSRLFRQLNDELSAEWEGTKRELRI